MITIHLSHECFIYDAYHITKAFFPNVEIKTQLVEGQSPSLRFYQKQEEIFTIMDPNHSKLPPKEDTVQRKECKHTINQQLYKHLSQYTGTSLDWGFMTGIRPTKIAMKKWREFTQQTEPKEEIPTKLAQNWLQSYYNVSPKKAVLALEIVEREAKTLETIDLQHGYSLYVGIPFCPTRCTYCSFTSYPLHQWEDKIDQYLDALFIELKYIGQVSSSKTLDTIYIGGGTPTSLSSHQMDRLLCKIKEYFPWHQAKEITVEAGRPDSISREKLQVIKDHGVSRISINPQTMQDKTLLEIGRNHTVADIYQVYQMAQEVGFTNINMDLIMGLPGETLEEVADTLAQIKTLKPQSLTIHSLAMKRASTLTASDTKIATQTPIGEMIDLAHQTARELNLVPYYLYRQKNMAGNYENIGYCSIDKVGIYNILIMEEKQSIVAAGAGASTKIVLPQETNNIVRIENVKNVDDYIVRIHEMIERKGEWLWH